jgi:hypothetical protein
MLAGNRVMLAGNQVMLYDGSAVQSQKKRGGNGSGGEDRCTDQARFDFLFFHLEESIKTKIAVKRDAVML